MIPPEHEILAVLDLMHVITALQSRRFPVARPEFRPQRHRPVVQPRLDNLRRECVGCLLQGLHVSDAHERVVVFAELHSGLPQPSLDIGVAVEVITGFKRDESPHAQNHRPHHLVAQVEIVIAITCAMPVQDRILSRSAGFPRH